MEFITAMFYFIFFISALFLSVYNFLYASRANGASAKLGIGLPRIIRRLVDLNVYITFILTLIIFFFLMTSLLSLRIPRL
jgi:hypothetical protein